MDAEVTTATSDRPTESTDTTVPNRYPYDPRSDGERCPLCTEPFVYFTEEAALEPTCVVFVCGDHYLADGDCPGARIKVYEDGFVSRSVFGSH